LTAALCLAVAWPSTAACAPVIATRTQSATVGMKAEILRSIGQLRRYTQVAAMATEELLGRARQRCRTPVLPAGWCGRFAHSESWETQLNVAAFSPSGLQGPVP